MVEEMFTLHDNGTWKLVNFPSGKSLVGFCYRWEFPVKYKLDGSFEGFKASLVANGTLDVRVAMLRPFPQ